MFKRRLKNIEATGFWTSGTSLWVLPCLGGKLVVLDTLIYTIMERQMIEYRSVCSLVGVQPPERLSWRDSLIARKFITDAVGPGEACVVAGGASKVQRRRLKKARRPWYSVESMNGGTREGMGSIKWTTILDRYCSLTSRQRACLDRVPSAEY